MTNVSMCVLCGGNIESLRRALVAPFLARRIWGRDTFEVELAQCLSCDFIFYNPRLDAAEEQRLYTGYRSDEYQEMRHASEPWYTRSFNRNLRNDDFISARQRKLSEMIRKFLPTSHPRILDFGGDRGQLVKDLLPGAKPSVFDISGIDPVDDVSHCRDLAECKAAKFDLILNSNVLEHVGFPRAVVDQMTSIAASETFAFVEVPCESPFNRMTMLKRLVQECVLTVSRPAVALSLAKPALLYLMHEHVNFFAPRSLHALMTCSGWNVLTSGVYPLKTPSGSISMTWCMAKK